MTGQLQKTRKTVIAVVAEERAGLTRRMQAQMLHTSRGETIRRKRRQAVLQYIDARGASRGMR
jgi:hypothetical protein